MNLEKYLGQKIVSLNRTSGRWYYWDEHIGYLIGSKNKSSLSIMDMSLINSVKNLIKDLDKTRVLVYNIKESLALARLKCDLSLTVPIVLAAMCTRMFTDIPYKKSDNTSSNNLYRIPGEVECVTKEGHTLYLSCYNSWEDCLIDVAQRYGTSRDEDECFKILFKELKFSLTLYRIYFVVTLLLMKGVDISEETMEMDSLGRQCHYRNISWRKGYKISRLFGRNKTYRKRPQESGRVNQTS